MSKIKRETIHIYGSELLIYDPKFPIKVPENNVPAEIIVHHALHSSCSIYDVHNWHLSFGWSGFGYHYFIRKDGSVWKGRRHSQRGSHCKQDGMNMKSIGICLEGCYEDWKHMSDTHVPVAQMNSLIVLTAWLQGIYNISNGAVLPHNHYSPKKCPGDHFPWSQFKTQLAIFHKSPDLSGNELEELRKTVDALQRQILTKSEKIADMIELITQLLDFSKK